MKTSSCLFRAVDLASLGALIAFAGCSHTPVRHSTLSLESQDHPSSALAQLGSRHFKGPTPLHTVKPIYPIEMRRANVSGLVRLDCVIDAAGRVMDAQVQSSTDAEFEEPAREAFMKWTFAPATRDGIAVKSRATIPMYFNCD
jgi:TonB family protein